MMSKTGADLLGLRTTDMESVGARPCAWFWPAHPLQRPSRDRAVQLHRQALRLECGAVPAELAHLLTSDAGQRG